MGSTSSQEIFHPPSFTIDCSDDNVTGVFLSPNKRLLAIGHGKENIRIYDVESQEEKKNIEGCCFSSLTYNVINVAFSPDSSQMVYRWEDSVRFLNLNTFEMEKEIKNDGGKWVSASYSPDGKLLAIGSADDKLCIYDLSKDSSTALIKSVEARIN